MATKEKKVTFVNTITTESEIIKVGSGVNLLFRVDYRERKIALQCPTDNQTYFSPLMKNSAIEDHLKFIRTYQLGINHCQKLLAIKK